MEFITMICIVGWIAIIIWSWSCALKDISLKGFKDSNITTKLVVIVYGIIIPIIAVILNIVM